MGLADAVPGVSGGTIALLLGIYHRLIGNIGILATCCGCLVRREFRSCRLKLRTVEWSFLIPLFIGIFLAFGILAHFIEDLLENYPPTHGRTVLWIGSGFSHYWYEDDSSVELHALWLHSTCRWSNFHAFVIKLRSDTRPDLSALFCGRDDCHLSYGPSGNFRIVSFVDDWDVCTSHPNGQ